MFGYVYCFNDYIKYIQNLLNKKKLGKLLYINFQRQNLGPIRNDVNVAYDLTSHDLSIILNLFKKKPKKLSHLKYQILKKNISDISNLHLKLDHIYIDINNSWLSPIKVRRTIIVGSKEDLKKQEMFVQNIYYVKYSEIQDGIQCLVKVRYKHKGEMAGITNDGKNLRVIFHKKVAGIDPGQSAAIYEGDDLIAGGFIMKR